MLIKLALIKCVGMGDSRCKLPGVEHPYLLIAIKRLSSVRFLFKLGLCVPNVSLLIVLKNFRSLTATGQSSEKRVGILSLLVEAWAVLINFHQTVLDSEELLLLGVKPFAFFLKFLKLKTPSEYDYLLGLIISYHIVQTLRVWQNMLFFWPIGVDYQLVNSILTGFSSR